MSEATLTRTVAVHNRGGIHVRAADLIAKLVRRFNAKVELVKGYQRVEATNVLQILSLATMAGEKLSLEATGPDAEAALDALTSLFAARFYDEQEPKTE